MDYGTYQRREEPPLSELFSTLSNQTMHLFRQEVRLAQAEMTEKASEAGRNAATIGVGLMLAMGAFHALVAALILVLAQYVETWVAALIVGLLLAAVGGLLVKFGIDKLKTIDPAPRETIDSVRESKEWLTEQI